MVNSEEQKKLDLIGLIYDTIDNPEGWHDLLEALGEELFSAASMEAFSDRDHQVIENVAPLTQKAFISALEPHLERTARLASQSKQVTAEKHLMLDVLDHLPLGVVLVGEKANVLGMNRFARNIIAESNDIWVAPDNRLMSKKSPGMGYLQHLIEQIFANSETQSVSCVITFPGGQESSALSLNLLRLGHNVIPGLDVQNAAAVLIATNSIERAISENALMEVYNVTHAEARLMRLLVAGQKLEEAADNLGIKFHTARAQLRAIFEKTDTHRQVDLVRMVLSGPAFFSSGNFCGRRLEAGKKSTDLLPEVLESVKEGTIRLDDGRRLGYAEYGDAQGFPLLFFHSADTCRYQYFIDMEMMADYGIRLIVPERPGYGLSDPAPHSRLLDYPKDIVALLDALDIAQCSLAAFSYSGAYASVCAHQIPERIRRVGLISNKYHCQQIRHLNAIPLTHRVLWATALYAPSFLKYSIDLITGGVRKNPETYFEKFLFKYCTEKDLEVFSDERFLEVYKYSVRAVAKNCSKGVCHSLITVMNSWGFELSEISADVQIWHGTDDRIVPCAYNKPFRSIPNSEYIPVANQGHYFIFNHWQQIFPKLIQERSEQVHAVDSTS